MLLSPPPEVWPQLRQTSGSPIRITGTSKFNTHYLSLIRISGHQPHRATHPGHTQRRPLQVATGVAQQPHAGPEARHVGAGGPAERHRRSRGQAGAAGAQ